MQQDNRAAEIDSLKFQLQHYEKMLCEAFDKNQELRVTKTIFQEIRKIKSLRKRLANNKKMSVQECNMPYSCTNYKAPVVPTIGAF